MLHTQNINLNMLKRYIKDVEIFANISDANTMIFKHSFFDFFDIIEIARQIFRVVNKCLL